MLLIFNTIEGVWGEYVYNFQFYYVIICGSRTMAGQGFYLLPYQTHNRLGYKYTHHFLDNQKTGIHYKNQARLLVYLFFAFSVSLLAVAYLNIFNYTCQILAIVILFELFGCMR